MKKSICIIGAGSWGTALSVLLSKNGHDVIMWSFMKEEVDMINTMREHIDKLPGVLVPESVVCTGNIEEALENPDIVVMVVPSQTIRANARSISKHIKDNTIVVCCSKGLEEDSCYTLSEVIEQEIPKARVVVLSGPSHAEEVARDIPTTVVAASKCLEASECVQDIFMSPKFRVYTNPDVLGVELGGSLKNVIALCAGISDGLGFGDNTKAALMTRGISEITRLGVAMGAHGETFSGLTGIGDLIVTCTSMHSRNRRAGILIGQGKKVQEALDEVKMVVEGITTAKAAYKLAIKAGVEMPIIDEAYKIIFENKNPKKAVVDLMMRNKKHEIEEVVPSNTNLHEKSS